MRWRQLISRPRLKSYLCHIACLVNIKAGEEIRCIIDQRFFIGDWNPARPISLLLDFKRSSPEDDWTQESADHQLYCGIAACVSRVEGFVISSPGFGGCGVKEGRRHAIFSTSHNAQSSYAHAGRSAGRRAHAISNLPILEGFWGHNFKDGISNSTMGLPRGATNRQQLSGQGNRLAVIPYWYSSLPYVSIRNVVIGPISVKTHQKTLESGSRQRLRLSVSSYAPVKQLP